MCFTKKFRLQPTERIQHVSRNIIIQLQLIEQKPLSMSLIERISDASNALGKARGPEVREVGAAG